MVSAWIEIKGFLHSLHKIFVALLVSAWIEMTSRNISPSHHDFKIFTIVPSGSAIAENLFKLLEE